MAVHSSLGPGLLEAVYETVLAHELRKWSLQVARQSALAVEYDGLKFDQGFKADIVVENKVIVELKCVEVLNNAHKKQILTYLRLTGMKLGYLLNFSAALMKQGIVRTVNHLSESKL